MHGIDTVVIGAGHAGLAMSRCLTERGVEHVVLERGRTAQSWRERRDSLRLLTPNWMSRLPGHAYRGGDPDGFMTAAELVAHLEGYARSFSAPVLDGTEVTEVRQERCGFLVRTSRGSWNADNVVIATGYHVHPAVPAHRASPQVLRLTSTEYRGPDELPEGGVLVVGASSSGVQIVDELCRSGRRTVLAVGAHTRLPRRYRGRDILFWLDRLGSLDRTLDELPQPWTARREPSLQLGGNGRDLDLGSLQEQGVILTGRLLRLDGNTAGFAGDGDLAFSVTAAESRLRRVLAGIDGLDPSAPPAAPLPPILPRPGPRALDLPRSQITSVIWATGLRPAYPWLHVPVLDETGRIRHSRGVTDVPGLYAIGLRFQYRRNSTFIDGARHDAAYLADHLLAARERNTPTCPRNAST